MSQLQALLENLCIGGGIADGWVSACIVLEVVRKGGFAARGDH